MPPEIYQRFMEQQEHQQEQSQQEEVHTPDININLSQRSKTWIWWLAGILLLIIFIGWREYGRKEEKAIAVNQAREQLIDVHYKKSIAFQEHLCDVENNNQLQIDSIKRILKFKPYVQTRKLYIDLSLPDAIDTFDSADYPE